jgi:hypothetical protein
MAQDKLVGAILPTGLLSASKIQTGPVGGGTGLLDPNGPRLVLLMSCKFLKSMAGMTGLEPAASAVTVEPRTVT